MSTEMSTREMVAEMAKAADLFVLDYVRSLDRPQIQHLLQCYEDSRSTGGANTGRAFTADCMTTEEDAPGRLTANMEATLKMRLDELDARARESEQEDLIAWLQSLGMGTAPAPVG